MENKKIENYLHLYLWCDVEIQATGMEYISHDTNLAILTGVYSKSVILKIGDDDGIDLGCDDIKPILRPISDMTDEESNELEDAMWGNFQDAMLGDKESVLKMFINDSSQDRPGYSITVKATNWLRKNGFDCDELIESGIAIKR